ncbi:serine/threonine-protein kinase [Thermosporothrix hazakensis]|jgi:serine/threonine-protein kinase|uniref:Serine/threonine-protein kinase n=1 Tax=Thermosporothrix hazakensis TaxID=644383 RepID=A0A326U250_THEHA|nr:serine/threonine-protein kinase [Thermosporothrix hazakensis]PZW25384.1 serine/threonine-protein kinase [Thermosporothrix hazakensis]GCE48768.1 hypothetical protein KTH_36370 [Thermosporothrix hazakensis]
MLDSHELLNTTLGNCRLTRILGQGGTSTVYLGRQQHPNRFVAVKVLYPRSTWESYEIFHARFWREVHIISRLSHRHIIPIYSYGTQPYPYLVMPYAREGSLEDMLARSGPPPFYRAIRYILAACSALDYAHQRDVIHRDLKPGNLLLLTPDTLVLADFGIASLQSSSLWGEQPTLTSSNIVLGTPAYMAPEMFMTRDIDHTVDIYALGILLYELLGGQIPRKQHPPFQAVNPQPLLSLSQQRPELPAAIDMIIWKATAYQPHRRYQSARHLAQDLQALFVAPDDQYTVYRSLYHYKPAHRKPVSSALQNTSRKPPDQKRRSAPRSTEPAPLCRPVVAKDDIQAFSFSGYSCSSVCVVV